MKQDDINPKFPTLDEVGKRKKWAKKVGRGGQMTQKHRDRTEPKYKALDMTEHALKVAIRTIDRHAGRIRESTSRTDKRIHDHDGGKFCHADRAGDCGS